MELSHFEVVGNTLIFGGYTNMPQYSPTNSAKSQAKVLPGFFNERSEYTTFGN
jgi:hypothetical protein